MCNETILFSSLMLTIINLHLLSSRVMIHLSLVHNDVNRNPTTKLKWSIFSLISEAKIKKKLQLRLKVLAQFPSEGFCDMVYRYNGQQGSSKYSFPHVLNFFKMFSAYLSTTKLAKLKEVQLCLKFMLLLTVLPTIFP